MRDLAIWQEEFNINLKKKIRGQKMAFQEIAELEEKINFLINTITQLRKEKEELIETLTQKEEENKKLKEDIERREEEKRILKEKIGSLIEKLSQI